MSAKEKLSDTLEWLQDQWVEFRERSGFFQAKVAIVVGYVVVVVLTLLVFPVPPPDIDVNVQQVQFGVSERTTVQVRNLELGRLSDAHVVIYGQGTGLDGKRSPGRWKTRKSRVITEGEPIRLEGRDLRNDKGRSAPASFTVDKVEIYDEGDLVATWPRRP